MGKKVCVSLSDKDYAALKMFVSAGKTEQRLVQRAQVILHAACDKSLRERSHCRDELTGMLEMAQAIPEKGH